MRILLVEPPKEIWFIMGDYLPPPYGIIQIAAYVERELLDIEIKILDCNAYKLNWDDLRRYIEDTKPEIVASSSLATCNTYEVARTLQTAKKVNPEIFTVTGGPHFSFLSEECLEKYPEIDAIVRGEGEVTFTEMIKKKLLDQPLNGVQGLTYSARAVMGTETLSRREVQEELYRCYNHFYGSWGRRVRGILSTNELKRRINWYMAGRGILVQLRELIP